MNGIVVTSERAGNRKHGKLSDMEILTLELDSYMPSIMPIRINYVTLCYGMILFLEPVANELVI